MGEMTVNAKMNACDPLRLPRSGGMSLLEVIIALLILTIGVLAVATMQVIGMQSSLRAKRSAGDSIFASGYIEEILSWTFDDTRIADLDDKFQPCNPDHGPFEVKPGGATIEWEVDDLFPVVHVKRICITVRRHHPNGERSVQTYHYTKPKCSIIAASGGE